MGQGGKESLLDRWEKKGGGRKLWRASEKGEIRPLGEGTLFLKKKKREWVVPSPRSTRGGIRQRGKTSLHYHGRKKGKHGSTSERFLRKGGYSTARGKEKSAVFPLKRRPGTMVA